MDRNRRKQIDALFDRMLDIEPSRRAETLATSCVGDDELRREVELLLRKAEEADKVNLQSVINSAIGRVIKQPSVLKPGQKIGHYTVKFQIGHGGMGQVWLAKDDRLGRDVAIKVLPPEFADDPERVNRFKREAYAVGQLNHSNIVTVHDTDKVADLGGELHFIVTEFIEGKTLRTLMTESNLTWRDAVMIAAQVASALNAAHSVNIIHRDIKPENIMVLANRHVKVLDFGIAKLGQGDREMGRQGDGEKARLLPCSPSLGRPVSPLAFTVPGALLGTAKYMSPEQARGEKLDVRTDIFSFGIVLYEMIAGRHPYSGMADEQIIAELKSDEEILPVSSIKANIPAALDSLIAKAMRKRREDRYASVVEMQTDIEHLKSLIRLSSEKREKHKLREQNADQLLTQYVVFHQTDPTTRIPLGALPGILRFAGLKRGKLERRLIRQSLFSGLVTNGWLILPVVLATLMAAAWLSVTETWGLKMLHDGHTEAVRQAVFSPDGKLLVSVSEDKQVIVWDFEKRERLATFNDHTDWVTAVAFSPDGKWFVTASADGSIIVWDAVRLKKNTVLPGQNGVVRTIAFSADGRRLITPTNDDRKNIWEVGSWNKLREVKTDGFRYGQFLLSSDGRWLMTPFGYVWDMDQERVIDDKRPYFWGGVTPYSKDTRPPFWSWAARSSDGRQIISIDAGGFVAFTETEQFEMPVKRKLTVHVRAHSDSGRAIAFSPDGRFAASGSEDIVLWDALTRKKLARFKHSANVASLTFSPKDNYLVSAHADGSILTWDMAERELISDFKEHHAAIETVAFSGTGKRMATAGEDRSIIIWDVERGLKDAVLLWHPIRITALAFSSDGQWLVSNDLDGNLALWDVNSGRLRWSFTAIKRVPADASYGVALSPDKQWVATSYGVYETGSGHLIYDFRTEGPPPDLGIPQPTEVRSLSFTMDGKLLVSVTSRGEVILRQTDDWQVKESQKLAGRHLVSVSLSPDGKWLATGEDEGYVRLWKTSPLRQVAVMEHSSQINAVAFSPDGKEVASASDDKTIALWNVGSRKRITSIGTHTAPVYAVAFSPDGKQIVSGGHDHSVRLYTRHRSLWGRPWE